MGKGSITGGGSAGLFTVALDYGSAVVEARITMLQARIAQVQSKITAQEAFIAGFQSAVAALEAAQSAAISAFRASGNGEAERKAVNATTNALLDTLQEVRPAEVTLEVLQAELAGLESDLSYTQSLDLTETRSLWCADYTTDGEGLSATIELDGEPPRILLAPGCPAPTVADGELIERGAMSAEQVYFNAAMLPGWQKWRPTFRSGHITALDRENDTADVTLDTALSSAQDLEINQAANLVAVPIEYMNCNSGAFLVGDDVVVKFEGQNWENPKVIGFVQEPKPCAPKELAFALEALSGSKRTVEPATPTYTAMYTGIAGTPTNIGGLNTQSIVPHDLPSPGWATYVPVDPERIKGGSYDQNDAVLRFDLALQRLEDSETFGTGSYGGFIIRTIEVEDHGASLTLPGEGEGQIGSPNLGGRITYFTDNRTATTVQNGDDEDITFAIGTTINGAYYAYVNDGGELFQDAEVYDGIFRSYFTAPSSIVVLFNEKRFRYDLKYGGPVPPLQNPDTTFTYVPTGDNSFAAPTAYKRWLWATYEFGAVLPDAP